MAPTLSALPSPHFLFVNNAIVSSASPPQTNFNLSCRSPARPDGGVARSHALTPTWPSLLQPHTNQPHFLPLPSPGLTATQQDEGKLGVVSVISIIVGKTIGVGAYSVPSAVFAGVGSVGMALVVWALGSLISFCGMAVYLDLGTAIPRSGGERVYLERIFRRPRMLATCMFMAYAVLLGFSTPNAIVLGEYALYAAGVTVNRWNVRAIAVLSVTLPCYVHARHPRLGLRLINVLGMAKLLMIALVVVSGIAGGLMGIGTSSGSRSHPLLGHHLDPDMEGRMGVSTARRNFQDVWQGSSSQPYDYATALFKVVYCFRGYSTANQVLSDVQDPVRTLRVAMPLALALVSAVYMAINVAFFLAIDKGEFRSAGVVAAGLLFRNVFGDSLGAHVLPLSVLVSAAGNIAATSFAQARVNEELAKGGLLPFAGFWASRGPSPARGLLLHWAVSVAVIVLPPPGKIYGFLVDMGGYPVSVVSVAVAGGLLYLHRTPSERWHSPAPAPCLTIFAFLASNWMLLLLPWIPPAGGHGESERFAYYAYPGTALAVLGSGAVYWCWWRFQGSGRGRGSYQRLNRADKEESNCDRELDSRGGMRRRAPCGCLKACHSNE